MYSEKVVSDMTELVGKNTKTLPHVWESRCAKKKKKTWEKLQVSTLNFTEVYNV